MVIRNITVTCRLKRNTVNYEQEEQGKTVKPTNSTPNLNMGRDTYLIWSGSEQYQSSESKYTRGHAHSDNVKGVHVHYRRSI